MAARSQAIVDHLAQKADAYRDKAMLSLTHGQPATPTTLGKELAVYVYRLNRQLNKVKAQEYLGKINGATGTFGAHLAACLMLTGWPSSREFVTNRMGLTWNPLTTQIESHDWQAELYGTISHTNRILHNLCVDVWMYISRGVFAQVPVKGATGSSTMPHKVNPIRFENAEANLEISCSLLDTLSATLVESRWQRDLTDSTTQRNIGSALGYSLLALNNLMGGLNSIHPNDVAIQAELDSNWRCSASRSRPPCAPASLQDCRVWISRTRRSRSSCAVTRYPRMTSNGSSTSSLRRSHCGASQGVDSGDIHRSCQQAG